MSALFKPLKVGAIELPNRFIMAPLTRCRASFPGHVPTPLMAEYYAQRASAGLIIAECTMVQEGHSAFICEPGVYSDEQVEGWKVTTEAVKKAGGRMFLQIWHAGRVSHPANSLTADQPVAPSAIRSTHRVSTMQGQVDAVEPRALTEAEIASTIQLFVKAAQNAIAAGFEGVEIHGANGYLIDQFLRESANSRDDQWGGSLENRARFLIDIVKAVSAAIGADRVGVRLSPLNSYNDMKTADPVATTRYVAEQLNELNIAYLHIMRADFFQAQIGDVVTPAREGFKGVLIGNMGYEAEEANKAIEAGTLDAVAFGTKFLANPDFIARVKAGASFNAPRSEFFYTQAAEGYTDYPLMSA